LRYLWLGNREISMSTQPDFSNSFVLIMVGVAVGIPASIITGIIGAGEGWGNPSAVTGWALIAGPFVGLALGGVLACVFRGSASEA